MIDHSFSPVSPRIAGGGEHCLASPQGGGPPQSGTHSPLSHTWSAPQHSPAHFSMSSHTPAVVLPVAALVSVCVPLALGSLDCVVPLVGSVAEFEFEFELLPAVVPADSLSTTIVPPPVGVSVRPVSEAAVLTSADSPARPSSPQAVRASNSARQGQVKRCEDDIGLLQARDPQVSQNGRAMALRR